MKKPNVVAKWAASLSGAALHRAEAQPASPAAAKNIALVHEDAAVTTQ
jgi:hypothetical protein